MLLLYIKISNGVKSKFWQVAKIILVLALLVWFGFFLARKIDLITADLGRHIVNGSIILHGSEADKHGVLATNFYSYTQTNFPFINHHWGSGVIFYLIFWAFGFFGLSVFYVLIGGLTLALYFYLALKRSNWLLATALALLLIPLMASRAEVRPEIFTYLFSGIFFWIVSEYAKFNVTTTADKSARYKKAAKLYLLPVVMLFWVNLHIGFIFGIFILGAFGLVELIRLVIARSASDEAIPSQKQIASNFAKASSDKCRMHLPTAGRLAMTKNKFWMLFKIGLLCAIATIINPAGIRGALYPFSIFRNYGYMIVENQSIRFLERLGVTSTMNFVLYKTALGLMFLSFLAVVVLQLIDRYRKIDNSTSVPTIITADKSARYNSTTFWAENLIAIALGVLGFMGIRHFPSFAFFALPAMAGNLNIVYRWQISKSGKLTVSKAIILPLCMFAIIISLWQGHSQLQLLRPILGFGLFPAINQSADFFKANNLKGPVFNNYDIGGYLIYHFYRSPLTSPIKAGKTIPPPPAGAGYSSLAGGETAGAAEKVFVDNRPEAYSQDFFENVYKKAQTDETKWKELDKQYNFESIFFSHRDYTPWGQEFLVTRVKDPSWAVVYYDPYAIIFLKRDKQNEANIKKLEIPKSIFGVR